MLISKSRMSLPSLSGGLAVSVVPEVCHVSVPEGCPALWVLLTGSHIAVVLQLPVHHSAPSHGGGRSAKKRRAKSCSGANPAYGFTRVVGGWKAMKVKELALPVSLPPAQLLGAAFEGCMEVALSCKQTHWEIISHPGCLDDFLFFCLSLVLSTIPK